MPYLQSLYIGRASARQYYFIPTKWLAINNFHNLYTKVVVQLDESSMVGEVVTAFPSPGIKGNISEGGIVYVKPRL